MAVYCGFISIHLCPQVYLKELERQQLQDTLHKDVMRKIIFLQRWFRARLQRKEYLGMKQAAILIQVHADTKKTC